MDAATSTSNDTKAIGENGAPELTAQGVNDARVALFFALVRGISTDRLKTLMDPLLHSTSQLSEEEQGLAVADAFVLAFQTRHCRGGKGEKDLFHFMIKILLMEYPKTVVEVLPLIPHYGSFKDWFQLIDWCSSTWWKELENPSHRSTLTNVMNSIYQLAKEQLLSDYAKCQSKEKPNGVSLLAKWAPRENKKWSYQAKKLAILMFPNSPTPRKEYRKVVSCINRTIHTTEVMMSANQWSEIDFTAHVPSVCLMKNRKAFLNETVKGPPLTEDEDLTGNRKPEDEGRVACRKRLREILEQPKSDDPNTKKLKGKQLFPHEIVNKIMHGSTLSDLEKQVFSSQWEDIRCNVLESLKKFEVIGDEACIRNNSGAINLGKMVSLVDVSGSMMGTPMEVAIALGLLVSELADPAFANRCLTFSSKPSWAILESTDTLVEKVGKMQRADWGYNTDFEAAMEKILDVATTAKLSPEQIPDLIVFSDMQFDQARRGNGSMWETHHERIVRRFREEGLKVCGKEWPAPRIVYWNLRGDTNGFPASGETPGVTMLSGFSPSLVKILLDGEPIPTPSSRVRKALDDKDYSRIRKVLNDSFEKKLSFYKMKEELAQAEKWELL